MLDDLEHLLSCARCDRPHSSSPERDEEAGSNNPVIYVGDHPPCLLILTQAAETKDSEAARRVANATNEGTSEVIKGLAIPYVRGGVALGGLIGASPMLAGEDVGETFKEVAEKIREGGDVDEADTSA